MSESVKLPDPVYKIAKKEAEQRDITIGAVVDSWRWKAMVLDKEHGEEPTTLSSEEMEELDHE